MKHLPLFAWLALGLSGCAGDNTGTRSQFVSCYDTGHGVKCIQTDRLAASTDIDADGAADRLVCATGEATTATSQSSDSGPSADDDATSQSSDTGAGARVAPGEDGGGDSADDASGESDSASGSGCGGGESEDSESTEVGASDSGDGSDSDADDDGVSDADDCDCVDPDGDGTPPQPDPQQPGQPPIT
jgi:hypothetical protein